MDRYTKRGLNGNVYATASASVCWGDRPISERVFCTGCHGSKDNRDIDRSKCGPLAIIDRLAAYEDTDLEPEEIKEVQEAVAPIPFGRFHDIMEAERAGRLVLLSDSNAPLTPEELREMDGEAVWVHRPTGGFNAVICVQRDGRVFLFGARNGRGEYVDLDDWKGLNMLKIYRCKPEEGK